MIVLDAGTKVITRVQDVPLLAGVTIWGVSVCCHKCGAVAENASYKARALESTREFRGMLHREFRYIGDSPTGCDCAKTVWLRNEVVPCDELMKEDYKYE